VRSLFFKTLRDKRTFIIGWTLGLFFLGFAITTFFTSFSGDAIKDLLANMPPAFEGLIGSIRDWSQLSSYIGSQVFDIRLPILIGILAIVLTVNLTVTEEDKGQLRTLVALPISRKNIVLAKWMAIVVICLIASAATVAGVEVGVLAIGETINQGILLQLGLMTWLMTTALATIIFALGLGTGIRSVTTPIGVTIVTTGFILSTFAPSVEWLKRIEWLSIFHYFPATEITRTGINGLDVVVYVLITVCALGFALFQFRRRDIYAE
jgi:ABC-2 type transport system permease protein